MNHDFSKRLDELESKSQEDGDFSLTILRQDMDSETHYCKHIKDWG